MLFMVCCCLLLFFNQSHKSLKVPVPYPTMHHYEMRISFMPSGALWDIGQAHFGICEIALSFKAIQWSLDRLCLMPIKHPDNYGQ